MNPLIETASAVTVMVALCIALIVLPRHKPEPPQQEQRPPVESVQAPKPAPVIVAEPRPPEQLQIDDVKAQVERIEQKAKRLEKLLDEKAGNK